MITDPWWSADRTERYRVVLLSQKEATIQTELDGVSGGQIDWGVTNEIRSAGNLDLTIADTNKNIDWAKVRLRIEYILRWNGVDKVYPMGVYIPSAPKVSMSATGSVINMEFYDKTIILKQDRLRSTKAFPKGSLMTDALRWIISSAGEKNMSITPSTKKFSSNRVYAAGTPRLEMAQKILDDLNYFALWCDGKGQFQCHPYVSPAKRITQPGGLVFEFVEGDKAIHRAEWTLDQDGFEVPNRIVAIQRTTGKKKALIGLAEDLSSRWGYAARGRWITQTLTDVDEKTQEKLDAKALTQLRHAQDVHDTLDIEHAFLPVEMNDIVRFRSQGYAGTFAFRSMTVILQPTVLVKSHLEGVST